MTIQHIETTIRTEIALLQLRIEDIGGQENGRRNLGEQTNLRNDLARLYHQYHKVTGRPYEAGKA